MSGNDWKWTDIAGQWLEMTGNGRKWLLENAEQDWKWLEMAGHG